MNNITYAVSVDVNNPIIPYNVYVANVLDSNVRYLEITLYQNGNVIVLSNEATATASLVTDDVLIDDSVECTISSNIITVPLKDLQRHGNLDVQVTVTEGTKVLAIPFPIQVRVTPNIAENAQIDENSLGSYAEVVHEIAEARGSYDKLKDRLDHTAAGTVLPNGSSNELVKADSTGKLNRSGAFVSNDQAKIINSSSAEKYVPTARAVAKKLSGYASTSSVPTKVSDLENDSDFASNDDVFEALDGALSGNSSNEPALLIDDIVDQTSNPDGNIILYYVDSDGTRHNIFDFSPYLGTDDYNELSNKPRISGVSNSGDSVNTDLTGTLRFDTPHLRVSDNQQNISVNLGNDVFVCNMFADPSWSKYNFDLLSVPFVTSGVFKIRENRVENKPAALSVLVGDFYIVHFLQGEEMPLIRYVIGKNANNINVTFMQTASLQNGSGFGINYDVVNQSAWQEIGAKGDKGDDGFSPTVSTTSEYLRTRVEITDVNGTHNFFVNDGESVKSAIIDANGDLKITIQGKPTSGVHPTYPERIYNVGHVVGADGSDYILTAQDKSDIADLVLAELPTTQGVQYGNTGN